MKQHLALIVVLAAAVGCGRPNDVARAQAEAEGVVNRAKPEVAELEHRVSILSMRGAKLTSAADYKLAGATLGEAQHELDTLKAELGKRSGEIAKAAAEQEEPRVIAEHLQAITDNTRESVRTHLAVAATDVTTGETWLVRAVEAPTAPPMPPPPAPETPTAPPTTDGASPTR